MASVDRVLRATPEQVWEVLCDGWLYPSWVVGASRMREVDDGWPAVGTQLHHSVGVWPALLDDSTRATVSQPARLLQLTARGWPMGEAMVRLTLETHPEGTLVTMTEDAISGPGTLVPRLLRDPGIRWRNVEALRRLSYLAERRDPRPR